MSILKQPGVDLYYELSGQGPPVLLIQGVGVVGEGWRPQVELLQHDFQTLIIDNRGIGKSAPCKSGVNIEEMAADVRALMDRVGWESTHVIGYSMGGVIAQELALGCPKRVRSLALVCTFGRGKDAARFTPWVLWMTLRTRLGTRGMRRRAFLEMLWPADELEGADQDRLAERMASLIGRDLADQPPILMKQMMALARHDCSRRLGELASIPTLVISAERDRIALPRYGRMLAAAIPGARFEEMPATSHGVIIQKADELTRRLRQFIGSVESAAR